MSPKACNSKGFVKLHETNLKDKIGYKGLLSGVQCFLPFCGEDYVFEVDEDFGEEQTCNVIVSGKTARITRTKNQNYSGRFVDGILIWQGNI